MSTRAMAEERLTKRRIEIKYLVPPGRVEEVVAAIPGSTAETYEAATLYLDTPARRLSRRSLASPWDAVKIRARDYLDGSPFVWVEVKERSGVWVRKSRFKASKRSFQSFLERGRFAPDPGLQCPCPDCAFRRDDGFRRLREIVPEPLQPLGLVFVRRKAFSFPAVPLRLTLDRDIEYFSCSRGAYAEGTELRRDQAGRSLLLEPCAVLEVKHEGRLPAWCRTLLETFESSTYSKFAMLARLNPPRPRARSRERAG